MKPATSPVAIRDQVLRAASALGRDQQFDPWPSLPRGTDLFLTILQDRLPGWLSRLAALPERPHAGPAEALTEVAAETIAFFAELQPAGLGAFTSIHELMRVRSALSAHGLHYRQAIDPIARYLRGERAAGRIIPEADPEGVAELLLAGCFHEAFEELLGGSARLAPRPERAARLVASLRLMP